MKNRLIRLLRFYLARFDFWLDTKTEKERSLHERVLIQAAMTAGGKIPVDVQLYEQSRDRKMVAIFGNGMVEVGIVSADGKTIKGWKLK